MSKGAEKPQNETPVMTEGNRADRLRDCYDNLAKMAFADAPAQPRRDTRPIVTCSTRGNEND